MDHWSSSLLSTTMTTKRVSLLCRAGPKVVHFLCLLPFNYMNGYPMPQKQLAPVLKFSFFVFFGRKSHSTSSSTPSGTPMNPPPKGKTLEGGPLLRGTNKNTKKPTPVFSYELHSICQQPKKNPQAIPSRSHQICLGSRSRSKSS